MAEKITTGRITYNVHERGREHIGVDRTFNLAALAKLVNSPEVQERVRNRDLQGYYGHIVRQKFGITPPENAVVGGKLINIEPALVTVYLRADENGNIEHEAEFLETSAGKIAARLFASKTGGFSSAIMANDRGGVDYPYMFGGFDYVLEPNYTTNRGYRFDSAAASADDAMAGLLLDSAMADWHSTTQATARLVDQLQADLARSLQAVASLAQENEELLSICARGGQMRLDDTSSMRFESPRMIDKRPVMALEQQAARFASAPLVGFEQEQERQDQADSDLQHAKSRWGMQ